MTFPLLCVWCVGCWGKVPAGTTRPVHPYVPICKEARIVTKSRPFRSGQACDACRIPYCGCFTEMRVLPDSDSGKPIRHRHESVELRRGRISPPMALPKGIGAAWVISERLSAVGLFARPSRANYSECSPMSSILCSISMHLKLTASSWSQPIGHSGSQQSLWRHRVDGCRDRISVNLRGHRPNFRRGSRAGW